MTAADYLASRPDLVTNWTRAHDTTWIAQNPASAAVVNFIQSFPTIEQYAQADFGQPFDAAPPQTAPATIVTPPADNITTAKNPNPSRIPSDAAHRYIGTDGQGDIYQLTDAAGAVLQWKVPYNGDSRAMIPGTLTQISGPTTALTGLSKSTNTPQASGTAAPTTTNGAPGIVNPIAPPTTGARDYNQNPTGSITAPITNTPTQKPDSLSSTLSSMPAHIAGDPSHKYVGTTAQGDVWQLYDAVNKRVLQWTVPVNADSRNIIAGTLQDLGPATPGTVAQAPGATSSVQTQPTVYLGGTTAGTVTTNTDGNPGVIQSPPGTPGAVNSNHPDAGGSSTSLGEPRQSDARHKYVGRITTTTGALDVWQIFDGLTVKQWKVNAGDYSAAILDGTIEDMGPPGPNTVAQADGTKPGAGLPTSTTNNTGTSTTSNTPPADTTTKPGQLGAPELLTIGAISLLKLAHLF